MSAAPPKPTITVFKDAVIWESSIRAKAGDAQVQIPIPFQSTRTTAWASNGTRVLSSRFVPVPEPFPVRFEDGDNDFFAASLWNSSNSSILFFEKEDGTATRVNSRFVMSMEQNLWGLMLVDIESAGDAMVTVSAVLPRVAWERSYLFNIVSGPKFDLEIGFTFTKATVEAVASVPSWTLQSVADCRLILKRSELNPSVRENEKRYAQRTSLAYDDSDTAEAGDDINVPAAQIYESVALLTGGSVEQHTRMGEVVLPFVRAYDHERHPTVVLQLLEVGDEELNGDLKDTFRVDPAPITFIGANSRMMARGIRPSGSQELLEIGSVDGIRVNRSVLSKSIQGQPSQKIEINFNNQRDEPLEIEIWERGAAKIQLTNGNRNIELHDPAAELLPDSEDGIVHLPVRLAKGPSSLIYQLYFYARK